MTVKGSIRTVKGAYELTAGTTKLIYKIGAFTFNDRGPFPSSNNPNSGKRIIDLSMGAAKKLGFYKKGTTRVRVEVVS